MRSEQPAGRGITFRSVAVSILTVLVGSIIIQVSGVADRWAVNMGSEALSPAALIPVLVLLFLGAGVFSLWRFRILTRAEFLCVMYATLIAMPLASHGFWRQMLGTAMSIPRNSLFDRLDALSPKLWPHGPNLLQGVLARSSGEDFTTQGRVVWREVEVSEGIPSQVAVLSNDSAHQVSWLRVRLDAKGLARDISHMITVQARARTLGAQSQYFCRVYHDRDSLFAIEAFTSRQEELKTYLHRTGFVRVGKYGVSFPTEIKECVDIEFGLSGEGTVELHDAQLVDVSAIETAFLGRRIISKEDFERLPPEQRLGLTVRPRTLWSVEGIKFLLIGFFPFSDWLVPGLVWGAFAVLVLAATFAIGVVMRRQWVQNERYPLPMAQVPFALLGDADSDERALPAVFKNRFLLIGFGVSLLWCLIRLFQTYNKAIPDVSIRFPLSPYFADPSWGNTWTDVNFSVYALTLGLGLFMELNVLMSMVVGFLLFRFQYWAGETYGLATLPDFPFMEEQLMGSYLAYALLALVFTRKYLWRVVKMAVKGERDGDESISYRTAFLTLLASLICVVLWARWAQLPASGMVALFVYVVCIGFVAMKLRAECGAPHGVFTAGLLVAVPLLGGMRFLGPSGVIFASLAAIVFGYYLCFFNIPGMQLELLEAGRRAGVRPRHLAVTAAIGVVGGIVIGGWVYLSSMYSVGADSYPLKAAHFEKSAGSFAVYNTELSRATETLVATGGQRITTVEPRVWAGVFAAVSTSVVTVLRQLFAGFWFHPVGLIMGPSKMLLWVWGSLLMAWLIRFMVLRLGGAATVRESLLPFATGLVLGSTAAYAVCFIVNGLMFFFNPGGERFSADFF